MIDPDIEMTDKIKIIRQQIFNDRLDRLKKEIMNFEIGYPYKPKEYIKYNNMCNEYESYFK